MSEQLLTTMHLQKGYAEEFICIEEANQLLRYSLSSNLDDIKNAILTRTGCMVNLENASWKINPMLSANVRHSMNKHNVVYSMTTFQEKGKEHIVVNMHLEDKWFFASYRKIRGIFYNSEYLCAIKVMIHILHNGEE